MKGFKQLQDAVEGEFGAKDVEGWVEKNGQPAHLENGTRIKLT